ncbi:helicase [Seminavis robusta]|uniref:Helicase n=1 Tax=Seminavis robusta TaxID=568900 RepID=A0A9N8HMX0_9STRA|nr:helicase [Seminavis robusta]|eukprot:Sro939_g222390.1 helicase (249) ;mRNA; r:6115-6861
MEKTSHHSSKRAAVKKSVKKAPKKEWDDWIADLREYKSQHGTVNVPARCKEHPSLSTWVANLRRRKTLTDEQRAQLTQLGFMWKCAGRGRLSKDWDVMFERLLEYKKQNGNCMVPQNREKYPHLSLWVKNQRADYHKGTLDEGRQERLEDVGFVWRVRPNSNTHATRKDTLWQKRYEELMQFQKRQGHCRVPLSYKENTSLAGWVNNQRSLFATGLIRKERREKLEKIGFHWNPSGRPSAMKKAEPKR